MRGRKIKRMTRTGAISSKVEQCRGTMATDVIAPS